MAVYNYAGGEINTKIVYYGPGLSGKTTNLEQIYSRLPREGKGKMVSMKTRTDRTLFFDFLPISVGEINGMQLRFLLYTVPGQVYYNATRKLVLKGVDAVVFVADSSPGRMQDNIESLRNLEDNLNDLGLTLKDIPWVIQLNKRDVPECIEKAVMEKELNIRNVPLFEAVATSGKGVYETFEGIARIVFARMQKDLISVESEGIAKQHPEKEKIDIEVVAKGVRNKDSETDESESLDNAEEREEEHESVSEFVDSVLEEKSSHDDSIDLGATREGYEEYGHLIDLNDEEEKAPKTAVRVKQEAGEMDIITDPLEKLSESSAAQTEAKPAERSATCMQVAEEKVIRVPVVIPGSDLNREVPVKIIVEIKVG